jgi:hypothetical protein
MAPQLPLREPERENFEFFLKLPDPDRAMLKDDVKTTQFMKPLFEFSGPAPVAAKPLISSCSPRCSATA